MSVVTACIACTSRSVSGYTLHCVIHEFWLVAFGLCHKEWCFSTGRNLPRMKIHQEATCSAIVTCEGNTIMILLRLASKFSNEDSLQEKAENVLWRKDRAQPAASWVSCGAFMAASNMRWIGCSKKHGMRPSVHGNSIIPPCEELHR